jgi:hypothetical protein
MTGTAWGSFRAAGALGDDDPDDAIDLAGLMPLTEPAWERWLAATVPCPAGCDDGLIGYDTCPVCAGWGRVRTDGGA